MLEGDGDGKEGELGQGLEEEEEEEKLLLLCGRLGCRFSLSLG